MANLKALGSLSGCSDERWQAIANGTADPTPAEIAAFLALSDERARWLARVLASWREGFAAGRRTGWREGYAAAEARHDAEWDITRGLLVGAVHSVLDPEGDARQRLRSAEATERRGAAERERAFVAKAYATPDKDRTDAQRATVQSYPPPRAKGRRLRAVDGGRG